MRVDFSAIDLAPNLGTDLAGYEPFLGRQPPRPRLVDHLLGLVAPVCVAPVTAFSDE